MKTRVHFTRIHVSSAQTQRKTPLLHTARV